VRTDATIGQEVLKSRGSSGFRIKVGTTSTARGRKSKPMIRAVSDATVMH